ncbi:glycosyltransferase [Rubripirellula reticaptiva]|uniref:2-deoxystreptamine glucosyltransferase n=1 Tax=Rubripirellula reticaptiva TaxID=2528013 RepID=A0A5C6FDA3_9BACT|nr:glycosyltransferase [Rubripirellula reticaptiva]TWU58234.1 2-deoxystreptamine glucosyltransferase [Rubripirellula reticaptiva]
MNDAKGAPIHVLLMISSMRGGGSEQQTLLLLRHLDRKRFTPHLYVLHRDGDLMSRIPADVNVHSFEDAPPRTGMYFPGRELRRQVRHLRSILKSQSIDVIYDRTFHMTMIAGPAAKAIGVPRVSTIVSPPEHALPLVESRFVELKRRRLAKAYRDSFRVVAVSRQAAESAHRYYGLTKQIIEVIPNPVDPYSLQESISAEPAIDDHNDNLSLVCVGRMTAEKGHRDLIDAMIMLDKTTRQLPKIWLRLIGDGPLRHDLEMRWNASPRTNVIEFMGRIDQPAKWIAAADALVLPSLFEGMPNVVLEAMSLGTPVIATRAGGTIELEHDEPTILWADPHSPDSLADAILEFAADPSSAKQRVVAASRMIQTRHNMATTAQRIEALLQQAVQAN